MNSKQLHLSVEKFAQLADPLFCCFEQGLLDGPSALNVSSEQRKLASKKNEASDVAANTSLSASLDLMNMDNAMANMEKVLLQNVYHEKMLLYRDHQVAYREGSAVSAIFFRHFCIFVFPFG